MNDTPLIVGISGFAQAGKDTAAEPLVKAGYVKTGFADPLRRMALDIDPVVAIRNGHPIHYKHAVELLGYEEAKRRYPGVRQFLKALGNGARMHVHRDVWVRALVENMTTPVVVTDVRFVNEAIAVRHATGEHGGRAVILRIDRPGVSAESDFENEVMTIPVDAVIANDKDIKTLHQRVFETLLDFTTLPQAL